MLFLLLALVSTVDGLFFPLAALYRPQCFLTKLVKAGGTIRGSYEVSGSSDEISVTLLHPTTGAAVWSSRQLADDFKHVTAIEGQYNFCFEQRSRGKQTASFQLHVSGDADYYEDISSNLASKTQAEKVAILTQQVEGKVYDLLDHQDFAITREAVHRDTTESTNSRVLWWSIGQVGVMVTLSLIQMYYIKSFFEIKLIV